MTSMDRRAARHAEIERDHRLVALSLAAALRRIARETGPAGVDPDRLWQRVEGALEQSRDAYRRLNNARINLRAQRGAHFDDSQPLPAALGCYRHRGNYRGVFRSMTALGVLLRRTRGMPGDAMHDGGAADIVQILHLRGELWTFEHDGSVHVFSQPGSASDAALAGRALPDPAADRHHADPDNESGGVPSRERHPSPPNTATTGLSVP
jgi:hypothetical protein